MVQNRQFIATSTPPVANRYVNLSDVASGGGSSSSNGSVSDGWLATTTTTPSAATSLSSLHNDDNEISFSTTVMAIREALEIIRIALDIMERKRFIFQTFLSTMSSAIVIVVVVV